jgi:rubrerythrin
MSKWESIDDVLDFAIANEIEAARFYTELSEKVTSSSVRALLLSFAREEEQHRAKLERVKCDGATGFSSRPVSQLGLADSLVEPSEAAHDALDYAAALVLAMKAEKAAFTLYTKLAEASEDAGLRSLFGELAAEEARHKLRFEIEYDEFVLSEN